MRKMKDSGVEWIGEIPETWQLQRGKVIFAQRTTKGNSEEILLAATQKYGMYPQSLLEGVVQVKEDTDLQTFKTVHKNDYVISLRSFQGGFEMSEYEGVCSPAYQVFYNRRPIDNRYYKMLFKSDGFIEKMNSLTVGIREGKNIQFSDFGRSLIPYPPIEEQKRIAKYLDEKCSKIDAIIARQEEIIEKLREYKSILISETVTRGLNQTAKMKNSLNSIIGEIPSEWRIGKLRFFTNKIGDGLHGTPIYDDTGDYYFINGNNLGSENVTIKPETRKINKTEANKYLVDLNEQTLLISLNGTIGNISKYEGEKIILSKSAGYIQVKSDVLDIDYLKYYLQSNAVKVMFELSFSGTTINNLSLETLRNLPICIAPLQEQVAIAQYLSKRITSLDKRIEKMTMIIKRMSEYKKALIYEVATGKKEV